MAWAELAASLLLVFLALGAMLLSRRWQSASGLPQGEVFYTDSGAWHRNSEALYAAELRLAGKPDYLVAQRDGTIIPVEVKSSRAPQEPYAGHVLQLMAYCLLVEATYGIRPTHGILQYADRAFAVDYTRQLEQDLLDSLAALCQDQGAPYVSRDHRDSRRCAACGYREACVETLV